MSQATKRMRRAREQSKRRHAIHQWTAEHPREWMSNQMLGRWEELPAVEVPGLWFGQVIVLRDTLEP